MRRALVVALLALTGCGPEAPVSASEVYVALPETVACPGALPDDLLAEAWVSGVADPTPLDVDETGAVSGVIEVGTGIKRTLVIDWYLQRDEVRVLLAQARVELDLTRPQEPEIDRQLDERDITVTGCTDVTDDQGRVGFPTISFAGQVVPPCDMDGDCGDEVALGCSNLGEICAGTDPLVAD